MVPSTKQEVEVDFLSWVASIGSKSKCTTSSPTSSTKLPNGVKAVPPVYYDDVVEFGNFKTMQEAVNAVPDGNSMRMFIVVKPGTYIYINFFPIALSNSTTNFLLNHEKFNSIYFSKNFV
jgi:pectin methylesterase-like acyl-CoA thioesterase